MNLVLETNGLAGRHDSNVAGKFGHNVKANTYLVDGHKTAINDYILRTMITVNQKRLFPTQVSNVALHELGLFSALKY